MSEEKKIPNIIGRNIELNSKDIDPVLYPELYAALVEREEAAAHQAALGLTIRSTSFANIVDLISEGEIHGLVAGDKSIYLDETPIQNTDGSYNFNGVVTESRTGTQAQTYIPGFGEVQDEVTVNVIATRASVSPDVSTPVTRQITNANIDAVVVTVFTPNLSDTNTTTGATSGNFVNYRFLLQSNGGGYVPVVVSQLWGKALSPFKKSHRIELTGSPPWDIRLDRSTVDSTDPTYYQNKIYFDSYTEIIDAKLAYPNSAIVSLKVDAAKFSSIPRRAFHCKGLKIKIPDNAIVRANGSLSFSGSWSGNFQVAYSNDPAWVFYDLLTNDRYGLGTFIPDAQVDKWALYTISQYCSAQISDGLGGTESRFSCNVYLQSQESAYKVIQDMASIFRGMSYWAAGSLTATQDAPSDPVYLYSQANVIDGNFNYSGASKRAKHTVALVTWNDPEDFYRPKVEYVEDQAAIALYGVVKTQVAAVGCTSRGQAHRAGKWILYAEQNESEIVTFATGIEGAVARPGQIINIADSNRSGRRLGGRISAATNTSVTVDSDFESSHVGDTLLVLLANGTLEQRVIATQNGRVVTVTLAFTSAPQVQSAWMISSSTIEAQSFRVLSVTEEKTGEIAISAIKHDSNKYAYIEDGTTLPTRSYTSFSDIPTTPTDLLLSENLFNSITGVRSKATLSWSAVPGVKAYVIRYQRNFDNLLQAETANLNEIEFLDILPGDYTFLVYSVSPIGKLSVPALLTQTVYGKTAKPQDVQNFSMFPNGNSNAFLTWTQATDLDVLVGGSVRIRHTPRITGATWASSIDVVDFVAGNMTFANAPLLYGTYLAKFVDSSGFESQTEAIIVTSIPIPLDLNVVSTQNEAGVFGGTKTNTEYNPSLGGLTLSTTALWDTLGPIDDILSLIDWNGDVIGAGTYEFLNNPIDLGQVFSSNLTANIKILAFDTGTFWDDITSLIDIWTDIDGADLASVNAKLYVRTTEDNPSGSPTWTVWKPFLTGAYLARGYEFRLDLTSTSVTENLIVQECDVTIDMPDRVEEHTAIVSGAGTYSLTFDFPFNAVPTIGITTHDLNTGDYYTITAKTVSGFDIVFRNSGGTAVSRTFDAIIKGYGLQS